MLLVEYGRILKIKDMAVNFIFVVTTSSNSHCYFRNGKLPCFSSSFDE